MNEQKVVKNPSEFLSELKKKAEETEKIIKSSFKNMLSALAYLGSSEYLLARVNSLNIKGIRYHNCVPKPHFVIYGFDIIAEPHHNNCFDREANCGVYLKIRLNFDYDREIDPYYKEEPKPEWCQLLFQFGVREEKYKNVRYGVIKGPLGGWDSEIMIEDFSEFTKFRELFFRTCESIGLTLRKG